MIPSVFPTPRSGPRTMGKSIASLVVLGVRSTRPVHAPTWVHSVGSFPKNFPAVERNSSSVSSDEGMAGVPCVAIFFTAEVRSFFSLLLTIGS